jgi:hypothetical protein
VRVGAFDMISGQFPRRGVIGARCLARSARASHEKLIVFLAFRWSILNESERIETTV